MRTIFLPHGHHCPLEQAPRIHCPGDIAVLFPQGDLVKGLFQVENIMHMLLTLFDQSIVKSGKGVGIFLTLLVHAAEVEDPSSCFAGSQK